MLSSVNPGEVFHNFDDVFYLCVRLHTAAAGVADLENTFNAVDDLMIFNEYVARILPIFK